MGFLEKLSAWLDHILDVLIMSMLRRLKKKKDRIDRILELCEVFGFKISENES